MRLVTYEVEHKGGLGVISRDGKWSILFAPWIWIIRPCRN